MSKLSLSCSEFKPFKRNTLMGFAVIKIDAMKLTIKDVAVHEKNGKRWAQLPSKPMVSRDGAVLKDDAGKIKYSVIMEFDGKEVRDAFSAAAVAAVIEKAPDAFAEEGSW